MGLADLRIGGPRRRDWCPHRWLPLQVRHARYDRYRPWWAPWLRRTRRVCVDCENEQ